jgi:Domain of unknown function (DU1801)
MLRPIDQFFLQQDEPIKSCLLALREFMLHFNKSITEEWKYGMPFYYYNGKMFCYLWIHKKHKQPYIGIVEGKKINHPDLLLEKRARMKILLIHPEKDIPIKTVRNILNEALKFY